jgi:hypothetical protein
LLAADAGGPATMISQPVLAWAARPFTGPSNASCSATWRRR